jgi:DNA-binding transcriptional ArsR family regulator
MTTRAARKAPVCRHENLARVFRAIGDQTRLQILYTLLERPICVGDLAVRLEMEVANLSYHLKVLRDASVVRVRAEGQRRLYSLSGRTRLGVAYLRPCDGCEIRLPLVDGV